MSLLTSDWSMGHLGAILKIENEVKSALHSRTFYNFVSDYFINFDSCSTSMRVALVQYKF